MKGIFDIHTHINDSTYVDQNIETKFIIQEALDANVGCLICSGYDIESSRKACRYATKYSIVYASVGIHPDVAANTTQEDLVILKDLCFSNKVVAIGEIGLDYHVKDLNKQKQIEIFKEQLKMAKKHKIPVILHIRDVENKIDAYNDTIKILREEKIDRGIVHCFTKDYKLAKEFVDLGFLISIPGVITFKNAPDYFIEMVQKLSINNIVVETDAPYLSPEPHRGKTNFPKHIVYTIKKIASIKKISENDVITRTAANAAEILNIK